ncbi:MAG: CocE/NonD family hydrolase [Asticcacaulis sp.]|uniref:CocE/NonD family hydrolase n=1 Tax=Asticcacaulis sp. TaxID=1872648 RepID=UPI0039E2A425
MRDGVRLHTVILIPDNSRNVPILLTRTPYDAEDIASHINATGDEQPFDGLGSRQTGGIYIRVLQDIRGLNRSGGQFAMTPPLANTGGYRSDTDEATDAYDTVDWLVHHLPQSNGAVGLIGTSYDGYTALMGLVKPHPAIKAVVAVNPMVDGWRGDDWFHNGAFRQLMLPSIWADGKRDLGNFPWRAGEVKNDYGAAIMRAGSVGSFAQGREFDTVPFWRDLLAHPAYDDYWKARAVDRVLTDHPSHVPLMLVHGLWDQEDMYGAMAVWRALRPVRASGRDIFLSIGPWNHGQAWYSGSELGPMRWNQDTSAWWREHVLAPFLAHYLSGSPMDIAAVTAFRSGENQWINLSDWPESSSATGARPSDQQGERNLYFLPGRHLGFEPVRGDSQSIGYISDPANPVPFMASSGPDAAWDDWLIADQRFVADRPDVLTFTSAPLTEPLTIQGTPVVHLTAASTGSDSDWVIKLIDAYPEDDAQSQAVSGALVPLAMDILRGRYRDGFTQARPLSPDAEHTYRLELPTVSHTFAPGHRIVVQVQSSWFPLYDRNPQTFEKNIFLARPSAYRVASQRITVSGKMQSYVSLPIISEPSPDIVSRGEGRGEVTNSGHDR